MERTRTSSARRGIYCRSLESVTRALRQRRAHGDLPRLTTVRGFLKERAKIVPLKSPDTSLQHHSQTTSRRIANRGPSLLLRRRTCDAPLPLALRELGVVVPRGSTATNAAGARVEDGGACLLVAAVLVQPVVQSLLWAVVARLGRGSVVQTSSRRVSAHGCAARPLRLPPGRRRRRGPSLRHALFRTKRRRTARTLAACEKACGAISLSLSLSLSLSSVCIEKRYAWRERERERRSTLKAKDSSFSDEKKERRRALTQALVVCRCGSDE